MKKSRKISIFILLTMSVAAVIGVGVYFADMLDGAALDESTLPTEASLRIYDKNGELMDRTGYVTIDEISSFIKNAFIAVEDKRFYEHNGIDLYRLVGAAIQNIKKGEITQGGSTISNQLVKNTHLSNQRTLQRKVQEAKITLELEKRYSKDQILEMYLNVVYFGKGIYGVGDACRVIYGVLPSEVSAIQAASLAATIANPSRYSILFNKTENEKRTKMILSLMREQGRLSSAEYLESQNGEITINYSDFNNNYDEIYHNSTLLEAKRILKDLTDKNADTSYKVYTFFDPKAQAAASYALSSYHLEDNNSHSKEITIADNYSGGIVAYASNNPRSGQVRRQPGSLLKPFIYTTAIEQGAILPDSQMMDEARDFEGYSPKNYGNTYYGWVSARDALSLSINTVAVDILDKIGIDAGYQAIEKSGIHLDQRDKNLSLALGGTTYGSTCTDIAKGYMTLANQGMQRELSFIRKIEDKSGKIVYERKSTDIYAFSRESTYLTTDMMMSCAKEGTAKQLKYLPYNVAAKTGTVAAKNGNSDAWCAAFTTSNTFVCRYSSEGDETLPDSVTGGNLPTKVIRATMKDLYANDAPKDFILPPFVKKVRIDKSIKEAFHKLVPYKNTGYGESETIFATANYTFDAADPERMLIGDIIINVIEDTPTIAFQPYPSLQYEVWLNGTKCPELSGIYQAEKQRFPIGKLEIYVYRGGRELWKTTRLVRLR